MIVRANGVLGVTAQPVEEGRHQLDMFFDTAGSQSSSPILTAASVLIGFHEAIEMDAEWNAVLKHYGVRSLHMVEFAHSKGQFATWKTASEKRANFLTELIGVAKRFVTQIIVHGLDMHAFRSTEKTFAITESIGGGYALCQIEGFNASYDWFSANVPLGTRAHVFAEDGDNGQGQMLNLLAKQKVDFGLTLLTTRDREDGNWTPLQLADFVAYEYRLLFEALLAKDAKKQRPPRQSLVALETSLPIQASLMEAEQIDHWCKSIRVPLRQPRS